MSLPAIETERLILRQITPDDAEAVFEIRGDERVTRYMSYCTYDSAELVRESIENFGDDTFAIVRKSDGLLIGEGGVYDSNMGNDFSEIGYNFRYDCLGNDYEAEAVRAMIKYAAENLDAKKFCFSHAEEDTDSGSVIEKCGLKFDRYGTFSKIDGSTEFRSKIYVGFIENMTYIKCESEEQ
ncbi:MAG: GNAT family N-acetyltransferase [Oscillospiraceae bacterium]|nr:GNAT family N-acetyltransferase [Oscillospiraceae bacterium]